MCVQTPSTYTQNDCTNTGIHTILHQTEDSWHFILRPPKPSSSLCSNSYVGIFWTTHNVRKKHFGMMNMQCIDDALNEWNVGEGHIWHTRSHHSPAKLTWWSPLLDNPYNKAPYWCQCVLCYVRPNTINLYSKWPYKYRDPYYIASNWGFMALHPPSSQTVFF